MEGRCGRMTVSPTNEECSNEDGSSYRGKFKVSTMKNVTYLKNFMYKKDPRRSANVSRGSMKRESYKSSNNSTKR